MSQRRQLLGISSLILVGILFVSCSSPLRDGPPKNFKNVSSIKDAKPRHLPRSKYGNPHYYTVKGHRYYVKATAKNYHERGIASWYGSKFTHRLTSSREQYDPWAMTAASPTLPIPTFVRVTNLKNGRHVIVKVNDRGPFAANRILDLSYAAATKLGYANKGTAMVDVQAIDPDEPLHIAKSHKSTNPHLYLQLGAFTDLHNAEHLQHEVTRLTQRHVRINTGKYETRPLYKVQVGPIRSVNESDQLQKKLQEKGLGHALTVIS